MENNLLEFVMNQFDDEERIKHEEAIKEINGNLIDRYHDLLSQGKSEEASYLECIASLGDIRNQLIVLKKAGTSHNAKKILLLIYLLSGLSVVTFFLSSGIGLGFLLMSVILFSYCYLYFFKQTKHGLTSDNAISAAKEWFGMTKSLFPLMIIWTIVSSLLIFETIFVLFSNLDKLVIQMFYQSTPVGVFFVLWLVFAFLIFLSLLTYYASIIKHYQTVTGNANTAFPLQKIVDKMKSRKNINFTRYKKRIYLKYVALSFLHVVISMLSETRQYYRGPVLLPSGDQEIRTVLTGSSSLFIKLTENLSNIGFILLLILLFAGIIGFALAYKYKATSIKKIFVVFNIFWLIILLTITFSFMIYTGAIHDFSTVIYYSIGVISVQTTFLILNKKYEELLYV